MKKEMKKILAMILVFSMIISLTACGNEKKEKEAMEATVQDLFTNISEGNFSDLGSSFQNMPDKLSEFLEKLSFNEDSDSDIILKLQEIIRSNAQNISCEIDSSKTVYNEEDGTGEVYATITYKNLKDSAVQIVEKILANTASTIVSKITGSGDSKKASEAIDEIFDETGSDEEVEVKFDMVSQDGKWVISNTDSTLVDLISGNTFSSFEKLIETYK